MRLLGYLPICGYLSLIPFVLPCGLRIYPSSNDNPFCQSVTFSPEASIQHTPLAGRGYRGWIRCRACAPTRPGN